MDVFETLFPGAPPETDPDDRAPASAPSGPSSPRRAAPAALRRHRRWLFILAAVVVLLGALAGGGLFAVRQAVNGYDHNIERFADPFKQIPGTDRPTRSNIGGDAMNVLLLGSDSRIDAGNPNQWSYGAQRTDAIMLVHVQAQRKNAVVVSIPRDSWVPIPGHGTAKINAAFSWGGPSLMVRTVEQLTGVRIDHVVVADFTGFKQLTDDLGGVDITIPAATSDERATWTAGLHHMTGEQALNYVRQRHNLPGGDFDRVKRQQTWIRAVFHQLRSTGTLTDPLALNRALTTLSKSVATDSGFDIGKIGDLLTSLAGLGSPDLYFVTAPTIGTGWSPDHTQSIVELDTKGDIRLWTAIRQDAVRGWIQQYHPALLPKTVR
jgi:LCP family protein required for cell wall assembly